MSIQSEINRIKTDKNSLITALEEKGIEIADGATLGDISIDVRETEVGIDTSDATASADEIFSGETAYVNGSKVTGSFTIDSELSNQTDLINQIKTALEGKASSGGSTESNKSEIETCTFTLATTLGTCNATSLCFTDYDKTNNSFIPRAFSEGSFSEVNIDSSEILRDGQWTVICGSIIWISVTEGGNVSITGTDECNILINELSSSYLSSKVVCIQAPLTADTNFTITFTD